MMSSRLSIVIENCLQKPLMTQPILPSESPDVWPCVYDELNFSDVFGPAPIDSFKEFSCDKSRNFEATINYDENIRSQPHSFVGFISENSHLNGIIISLLNEEEDGAPELAGSDVEKHRENFLN